MSHAYQQRATRAEQIEDLLPLVGKVARRISRRLPPGISLDDLCSAGVVGLVQAVDSFDTARGVSLGAYAQGRIRGAILDELRRGDMVPRRLRAKMRRIVNARQRFAADGVEPSDEELALAAECSVSDVINFSQGVVGSGVVALGAIEHSLPSRSTPDEQLARLDLVRELQEALAQLSERQRGVLVAYYQHEQTYAQIGQRLGVSEARICQIHKQAVRRLRDLLPACPVDIKFDRREKTVSRVA